MPLLRRGCRSERLSDRALRLRPWNAGAAEHVRHLLQPRSARRNEGHDDHRRHLASLLRLAKYNRTADALSPSEQSRLSDQGYIDANTGTANLTNVLALPFVGVNTDFGTKNFRAGYAAYIPFGGLATWDRTDGVPGSPGSTDGVQRWHNISGQILAIYNTFAVAYRIAPAKLSIGASVSPVIHHVATVRARNGDGSDDTVIERLRWSKDARSSTRRE